MAKAVLLFLVVTFYPTICFAYIDPNAGGWLFQLLFPVFVALGATWLMFKSHLIRIVHKLWKQKKDQN